VIPRPKRTIRVVLWVDEEISGRGAQTYYQDHINELNNHVLAMESDSGNFIPTGFGFSGSKDAFQIITEIGQVLLSPIGAGNMTFGNGADADNGPLVQAGVPGGSLTSTGFEVLGKPAYYFFFHHTNADTFTAIDPHGMKSSVAAFGIMSYVVADMDQTLPR
jgi:carboxypeptidase Q